ncbi:MAG: CotH kinase family protein [Ruminococcus sp.]|nr:CotH kinase family protein [Ruminococcus sp.]
MRYLKRILACTLCCVMLAGCSGSDSGTSGSESPDAAGSNADKTGSAAESSTSKPRSAEVSGVLPVIEINTVSNEDGVMDFVNKPVTKHVSKSIASWTPGYKIPVEPYYEDCTVNVKNSGGSALLEGAAAQVKVRGNWTTSYPKKPLRIKFEKKQSMLGLNSGAELKNWVLLAEYKDISMLRNKAALQTARELTEQDGLYAADSQLVEVVINDKYWGVYLLTEQQQVNSDRVSVTKPDEGYTGTDIGYFLEYDGYYVNEDKLHQFLCTYDSNAPLKPYDGSGGSGEYYPVKDKRYPNKTLVGFTIKSDINSEAQRDFISSFVNNAYTVMYEAAYNDKAYAFNESFTEISETDKLTPEEAVRACVNVDSLADAYILAELTCDADIYLTSFFMDADFGEGGDRKLTFEAPWDFDSAMGLKNRVTSGEGFYAANAIWDVNDSYKSVNPWLAVLMYEPWFQDIIKEKWSAAYDDGVFSRTIDMVESDAEQYEEAFTLNYDRWNNINFNDASNEWSSGIKACRTQKDAADQLAQWLTARVGFMNEAWHK